MIWPFTTITKLREELCVTQENLRLAEGHLKALMNELPAAKERHTKVLETKQLLLDALRQELGVTRSALTIAENDLHWRKTQLSVSQMALIKAQKALAQAQKNDTPKDTQSGKFAKKAPKAK